MAAERSNAPPTGIADRELVISRVVNAPRALVFKAFTDRDNITHWWGPTGFRTTTHEMDVRAGGEWLFTMHGPDGNYPNKVVYIEVVEAERLVYHHGSGGDVQNDPNSFLVTTTFTDQGGKTLVTMRALFNTAAQLEGHKQFGAVEGGHQTLERLDAHLTQRALP